MPSVGSRKPESTLVSPPLSHQLLQQPCRPCSLQLSSGSRFFYHAPCLPPGESIAHPDHCTASQPVSLLPASLPAHPHPPFIQSKAFKAQVLVAQSRLTLCDPTDCSPPGSSVHGILQARILEWVAIPFSRASSRPRDRTRVSCITGGFFTV